MAVDKPTMEKIPIWVRFPKLSFDLWNAEGLSLIASHVGKPLFTDKTTSTQSNLAYARLCVEINTDFENHTELPVKYIGGDAFVQQVRYEWLPEKCETCGKFGHNTQKCQVVVTTKYVPKAFVKGKEVEGNRS